MKVFISGPMSGKPNGNKEVFFKAEYKLKGLGYSVFNPAWFRYGYNTEFSEYDMRSIDFTALDHCDAIYMLKGWQYSKGANAEYEYAKMHGKQILRENDHITDPMLHDSAHCWGKEPVIDSLEKWRNDFAECYTVNITNLRKEVEAIKESIGTDNLQEQLEKDFANVYEEFQSTKDKVNEIEFSNLDMSCKMSSAIDEMTKVRETVKGLSSLEKQYKDLAEELDVYIDVYIDDYEHLDNADEALERRIKALEIKAKDFDNWFDGLSGAIDNCGKDIKVVNNTLSTIDSCLDDLNNRIKALEKKSDDCTKQMNLFSREIETYEEAYKQLRTSLDNNDNALEKRIKAIEKRLSIKPFYEPTEDEKDD